MLTIVGKGLQRDYFMLFPTPGPCNKGRESELGRQFCFLNFHTPKNVHYDWPVSKLEGGLWSVTAHARDNRIDGSRSLENERKH